MVGINGNKFIELSNRQAFILSLIWNIHGFSLRKMELVKKLGYDDMAMNSDEYMTRFFYLNCKKVAFSDGVFYYRQDNASAITKKFSLSLFDFIFTNNRIIKLIIENNFERKILENFVIFSLRIIKDMEEKLETNKSLISEDEYTKARKMIETGFAEIKHLNLW